MQNEERREEPYIATQKAFYYLLIHRKSKDLKVPGIYISSCSVGLSAQIELLVDEGCSRLFLRGAALCSISAAFLPLEC